MKYIRCKDAPESFKRPKVLETISLNRKQKQETNRM